MTLILKLSIGAGWGKYDNGHGYSNPFGIFSDILRIEILSSSNMEEH